MLQQDQSIVPDLGAIRADLTYMVARWGELAERARFEVRAFKESRSPVILKYSPDWMDEAVEQIADLNGRGYNVYTVRNPLRADYQDSATDADVIAAFFLWADCDDPAAAGNVYRFDGPKWSAAVTTGTIPSIRVHTYWMLEQPCTDLAAWREMQVTISRHFQSDPSVINPSRIMRIGGTVSWPDSRKQQRGYVTEVTKIRTVYDEARPRVTLDQMARVFGSATPPPETPAGPRIDTGTDYGPALDRALAIASIKSDRNWRNNVKALVASYVARGWTDDEILDRCDAFTLPGYTAADTRQDVAAFIMWTREQESRNGGRYATSPASAADPTAHLFREMSEGEKAAVPALDFKPWGIRNLAAIPAPEFVYTDFYARGYTSLTVAPPKAGKTMLGMAESIDMASGRGILSGEPRDPVRVLYYNAEDDQSVLDSRVAALLCHYGIDQSEISESLFPVSGIDAEGFYMVTGQEGTINEALFVALGKFVLEHRIDVVIFDPLQDLSRSPETNEVFRALGQRLRRFANAHRVAIGIVHHTRKMAPGVVATIDDARGGGSLRGTARFNRLLVPMTEEEGFKAGVENHRYFLRIAEMEANLAPPSADVNRWFQKVSVPIPNGHNVGVLEPWQWPDAFANVTREDACRVQAALREMEDEPPRLNTQSAQWVGHVVARVLSIDADDKAARNRIGAMVKTWIRTGVLEVVEIRDVRQGRDVKAVLAGQNNPMTQVET